MRYDGIYGSYRLTPRLSDGETVLPPEQRMIFMTARTFTIAGTALAVILAFTSTSHAQDEVHFYLVKGALYADSKEHLKDAMQMLGDKDYQAMAQMTIAGNLSTPTNKRMEIAFTNGVPVFSGAVEFRFEGDSTKYWTEMEVVEDGKTAAKEPSPTPEPTTEIGRLINNLTDTYANQYGDKVATKLQNIEWSANEAAQEKFPKNKKSAGVYTKKIYDGVLTNLVTKGLLKTQDVKNVEMSPD
jgi:hypothetical protein